MRRDRASDRLAIDRRRFLALGASAAAGLLASCDAQGSKGARRIVRGFEGKNEVLERGIFHAGSRNRVARDAALSGRAFPTYYVSNTMPVWDPAARGAWSLEVAGLVRRPLRLSLDDLTRMRTVTQRVDHFCVEGWTARAEWAGVRLSEIARAAGVMPDAGYVDFVSFDADYHESWDLESAMHPQTLIAYGMDGRYLGPGHGAPARVHSPVKLGYKNTKYLVKLVFLPARNGGYWSDQGYEWYGGV
jgi:DMSO/TMAO reductase YedYZ molybdopterin-dependent catalytic subunit